MKISMLPLFCAAFAAALTLTAPDAQALPEWTAPKDVSQGRAFVVKGQDNAPFKTTVTWRNQKFTVSAVQHKGAWTADIMLAVPRNASKDLPLTLASLDEKGGKESCRFTVRPLKVQWKEQKLTITQHSGTGNGGTPPKPDFWERLRKEKERSDKAKAGLPDMTAHWTLPLLRPVDGTVSNAFGGRRIINGQPKNPHSGSDLRGPVGTPIKAVADGVVVLAEKQYFSGNVIFVDHGQGVVSMYAHMSAFDVKVGDRVKRGQVIGKVGATGRVTGPHLHAGFYVHGVAVDIMPLFEQKLQVVGGPTKEVPRSQLK